MSKGPGNVIAGQFGNTKSPDVFNAETPVTSKSLGRLQVLGALKGNVIGLTMLNLANMKASAYKTAVDTSCTITFPSETPPTILLTIDKGTAHKGVDAQFSNDGGTNVYSPFKALATLPIHFETRVKLSSITDTAFLIGLIKTSASALLDGSDDSAVTDGIYFTKSKTTGALSLVIMKASTATTISLGVSMVADTYIDLGFRINGVGSIDYWAGSVKGKATTMTYLTSEQLTVAYAYHITATNGVANRTGRIARLSAFQKAVA